ncbi:kinase-like domain-containing protein [Thelephora terrestris]|nr:kinase-like domain-containing protein [Thelephora terrestris]
MCVEEGTVAGGRHANVLKGRLDGRDVAVKAYRHYMHCFDHDQVRMRCQKETHAHNLLSHRNIVPLVGVYSTQEHPLSLVFDILAEHQDLIAYLRDKPYATKVQLLAEIARGLHHMHAMGVVHGNLERANIVVESDCTPRITGLGSAFVQSPQVNWPEVPPELTRCSAPELVNPGRFGLPRAQITKQSDVYSFGVLAYEVLAGDCVFPHLRADIAAIYAMSSGTRPPRPHDPELSNRFWDMINKCWANEPSERIPIAEVVSALEIELEEARAKLSP